MSNHDFTLKSGEKLHVTTAAFEDAIALVEAVKQLTIGREDSENLDDFVLASPEVRKALQPCFSGAMWGIHKVSVALFDDPKLGEKARSDYFEICMRVVEVNVKPFFLSRHSVSTTSPQTGPGGRG